MTITAQLDEPASLIFAQVLDLDWEGWRTEPRDWHGRWAHEGSAVASKAEGYIRSVTGRLHPRELGEYDTPAYKREVLNPAFHYTPEQVKAIHGYAEHYQEINDAARAGKDHAGADAISSAMQPLPQDLILLREVSGKHTLDDVNPGDLIADQGFSSTTLRTGNRYASGRDDTTVMHILTPAGTPALADRMADFRPGTIGHVDLGTEPPISLAAQALSPDAADPVPSAVGAPVPDDPTAIAMYTAHRLDDTGRHLAHATERMQAARAATGELRAYHSGHVAFHLQRALDNGHRLTANIRAHYPAEAAELEQVKQAVGLAKSLTPGIKAATTAHLLETTLHEETHGVRHAEAMGDTEPDDVWAFNADHCEKHLGGAVEHAGKLAQHFRDNYPDVARWLDGLDEITSPAEEDGGGKPQHARYAKSSGTVSAQMANGETISGQARQAQA